MRSDVWHIAPTKLRIERQHKTFGTAAREIALIVRLVQDLLRVLGSLRIARHARQAAMENAYAYTHEVCRERIDRLRSTAGRADRGVEIEACNPVAEAWNLTILQAAKVVTFVIPDVLVRSSIEYSYAAAQKLAGPDGIARQAGVQDIKQLKNKPLEECDRLAQGVCIAARTLATVEGAVTGVGGFVTTTIDVPL